MIKFWKDDLKYIGRTYIACNLSMNKYDYYYTYSVIGESANYLRNKYGLDYPNIQVHLFTCDNTMTVTSKTENRLNSDVTDIEEGDLKELLSILQEIGWDKNRIWLGGVIMKEEYIGTDELCKVITEIDSRYVTNNLIYSEYQELSWVELCNKAIKLLEELRGE